MDNNLKKIYLKLADSYGLENKSEDEKLLWADCNAPSIILDVMAQFQTEDIFAYYERAKNLEDFKNAKQEYVDYWKRFILIS